MRLALGTVQFGLNYGVSNDNGVVKFNEVKKIINFAKKNNINFIDTASTYGSSQKKLGKNNLKKFNIISKLPKLPKNIKKNKIGSWIEDKLRSFQKKLNIKKFYSIQVHHADDLLRKNGYIIFNKLNELKKKKFLLKIGVSIYTVAQLKKILKKFKLDLVNFPFSIGNTKFLDRKLISLLKKNKIKIHARSIFMQGLLLIKNKNKIPKKFKNSYFLENWYAFLKKNKINSLEACIQFIKLRKEIDVVTVGIENLKQLKQIMEILNKKKKISFPKNLNQFKYSNISKW
jgi:aryl-alcohol dehydrogenase-like predicted oxidoreductase